jgi:hypothetical protein
VTLSEGRLRAIARAVQAGGGDVDDAEDLADVWERMERVWTPRVDCMRRLAARSRCVCGRFSEPDRRFRNPPPHGQVGSTDAGLCQ